ncbi:hypothetical protein ACFX2I_023381 [Malus domestica]|uniref:Protease Do-like PDZ domain-containing protein n=1 Tax=Malus domestica TaxID=3750 RepID=A0A498HDA4_MALDO|nr:hypothetical protein DVH24_037222 [Malus domestica]
MHALVKVLPNFETLEFNVKLAKHKELIPSHIEGKPPFVFTAVSLPYLRSEFGNIFDVPTKLLDKHLHAMAQSIDEQLVVVSQVLTFNGMPVKNLKNLASMVENCDDEYLKFGLEYNQMVVLQTKTAKAATLLTTHCISSSMSDDLKTKENTLEEVHSMANDLRDTILEKVEDSRFIIL